MTRIILIRHGETDWNKEGRFQGQLDIPLNQRGVDQARQMAQKLSDLNLNAIYSSDLERSRCTAQFLANETGLEVQIDPRLREINLGTWEGKLVKEIRVSSPELYEQRRKYPDRIAPPEGETGLQIERRLLAALEDIAAENPCGDVAVVTHGFAIAILLAHFHDILRDHIWDYVPNNGEFHSIELHKT